MVKKETVIINQLSEDRAELVSYCRFMNNKEVGWEKIHKEKSKGLDSLASGKHVLVINDTTEINYETHRSYLSTNDKDLGPVGNNIDIGFFCHPGMVVDASNGVALGFSYLKLWNRSWDKESKKARNYKNQEIEEKESFRWIECGLESKEILKLAKQITIVADRESDIYEEFYIAPDERANVIIRSRGDRKLADTDKTLYETISEKEVQETYHLHVCKTGKRKARDTEIEVKYGKALLRKPQNRKISSDIPGSIEVYWVEAKEKPEFVPAGEEAIHWVLLTTHKVDNLTDAFQIISWYKLRWQIELLFSTMKSKGINVEASELEKGKALKAMCSLALHVSLKINQLRQLRNDTTGISAEITFTKKQIALLKILTKQYERKTAKQSNPYQYATIAWAAWTIARLGGWKGYARESPPGNKTFKWGLDRFYAMYEGFILNKKMCA